MGARTIARLFPKKLTMNGLQHSLALSRPRHAAGHSGEEDDRGCDECCGEARDAAEVLDEGVAFAAGEEDSAAHDVQVEERGDGGEDADGESGAGGDGGTYGAVGEPVEVLRESGDADDDDGVAEQAGTEGQGALLQSGIEAGRQGDIEDFDEDDGEAAADSAARHGREINDGASRSAEEGAFPVPAGERLREEGRGAGGIHGFRVLL